MNLQYSPAPILRDGTRFLLIAEAAHMNPFLECI